MDMGYESFSATNTFHTTLIEKRIGGLSVEDFLKPYREMYKNLYPVDPALGWQICQYDGRATIGVFDVIDQNGNEIQMAFIARDIGRVTDFASVWFRQNRMHGNVRKPSVSVSPHRSVYPIENPYGE